LFRRSDALPLLSADIDYHVWARAKKLADLPRWATPHDLRHYYASVLIAQGRSVKEVQARLGHATAKETLDTYAHLWPSDEDGTRAAIDAVLGRGSNCPAPAMMSEPSAPLGGSGIA